MSSVAGSFADFLLSKVLVCRTLETPTAIADDINYEGLIRSVAIILITEVTGSGIHQSTTALEIDIPIDHPMSARTKRRLGLRHNKPYGQKAPTCPWS